MRHRIVCSTIVVVGAIVAALSPVPTRAADVPGAVTTIDVKPVVGSQALAVSGTAPAGQSVRVTLYATISRNIPDVLLSSKTIDSGARGTFATAMPIAPAFMAGTVITAVASVLPAGPAATARWTVAAPNVTVPPDNLPNDIR